MKATENTVEWVHIGSIRFITFLATDVLISGSGCVLHFFNMLTGENQMMFANRHCVNGDGITAVRGHRFIHTFAYAESSGQAEVHVKEYPSLKTIVTFDDGPAAGYANLVFSDTSLLIALGHLPDFVITIWNWRKKEKLGEVRSNIRMEHQMLRCSPGKPVSLVQLGTNSDKLYLWDVFTCCSTAVLAKHELKFHKEQFVLAHFNDCVWTLDADLYVVDLNGCFYSMNKEDFCLDKAIDYHIEGDIPTSISLYKSGIAISGPNLEVRHYVKNGSWKCNWILSLEVGIKRIFSNRPDFLVGVTVDEEIVSITQTHVKSLRRDTNMFDDFCVIYPAGKYICALRRHSVLDIYSVRLGNGIGSIKLNGTALALAENPELPYVAIGYDNGILELISIYKPKQPTVMTSFHLTKNRIENIRFFEQGRIIVAGCSDIGEFFIIEGLPGSHMKVIAAINANRQIVDFILIACKKCYRLFLIPVTGLFLSGNKIIRYCIIGKGNANVKDYVMENDEFFYHGLIPTRAVTRDRIFYGLPYNSRTIHVLETKRGDSFVRIISEIKTGHQMRKIGLHITKDHAVTWGYDGLVIARDNNFNKPVGMALPHHRYYGGVKKAYIDPLGKYIISLGRENNLICTNVVANEIDEEIRKRISEWKISTAYALMFKRPTIGFVPEGRFQDKTWLEMEEILEIEREEELCRIEKTDIREQFRVIKSEVIDLVNKNFECPENEKLDLLEFYLDNSLFNSKRNQNKHDCRYTEIYLKALIVAQDVVTKYLLENYWNKMDITGKMIFGIFVNTAINKYILLPPDIDMLNRLAWIEEQRKVEKFLSMKGSFRPSVALHEKEILALARKPKAPKEDYNNLKLMEFMQELNWKTLKSIESQQAESGSVSSQIIEAHPGHYNQEQIVTFLQCSFEQIVSDYDGLKIKKNFNDIFEELVKQKGRDMAFIKERNSRLRTIISEVNYFSSKKINLVITDPVLAQREQPEQLTKVLDFEMTITPYISPSEQEILDAKAAEEERIRLALLADDFKERALMAMMNGVLEIRWEDELKKDVPIPKCMVEKDPEQFNEEDLRAIKEYEDKVAFLNSERERYKNLLDNEFTKISIHLRDLVRKFNNKLKDVLDCKMMAESALIQEKLKVNRLRCKEYLRVQLLNRQEEIQVSIKDVEEDILELRATVNTLHEIFNDCQVEMDVYQTKEKPLEKAFKKEIQDLSPAVQECAIKLYKKRPKLGFRSITTWAIYNELARCVANNETSLILTDECFEYLKCLDHMDQYATAAGMVDEHTYAVVCKHRRLRIEFEIRVTAFQVQMDDGKITTATYSNRLAIRKENISHLQAELQQVRKEYAYLIHNVQTQYVLRRGLVEVPLSGQLNDFDDAILIPRREIEFVNRLIKEAGNKKIQAIMKNMSLRRNIMDKEWTHRKLRMIINDLIEHITDIEAVQLTKEMQIFLRDKAMGRRTANNAETELENMATIFQHRIKDISDKLKKYKKQIQSYRDHNSALDKAIKNVNLDVCHLKLQEDDELQKKESLVVRSRMNALLKRSNLVLQIQNNHNDLMLLQTELEILRLKRYPTFKYKVIRN